MLLQDIVKAFIIPSYIVYGGILSLLLLFSFCTVTDFSAGASPMSVKFYMTFRPHLGQVFSHFGGTPRDG